MTPPSFAGLAVATIALCATLCSAGCASTGSALDHKRCALLVGINTYGPQHTPKAKGLQWGPLEGTGNDVAAMKAVLSRRYGFQVATLRDQEATEAGIAAAFREKLVDCVKGPRDVALFYYSGHGHQIPDDTPGEEVDGLDEALVAYDNSGGEDPRYEGYVRDDTMAKWIAKLREKTRNVVTIFDSCHSGTAHRGGAGRKRGLGGAGTRSGSAKVDAFVAGEGGAGATVTLSAAGSDEPAMESEAPNCQVATGDPATPSGPCPMGRFTRALVAELQRAPAGTTYGQLTEQVYATLLGTSDEQNPQVHGASNSMLFGAGRGQLMPTTYKILPAPPGATTVDLHDAGWVHGLRRGAVLVVGNAAGGTAAKLELTEVGATRSVARLLPVDRGGVRGVTLAFFGRPRLGTVDPTYVMAGATHVRDAAVVQGLPKRLKMLPFAKAAGADFYSVRVVRKGDRVGLHTDTGKTVRFPVGPDKPMVASVGHDDPRLVDRIEAALEVDHRRRQLKRLGRRHREWALKIDFVVERSTTSLVWNNGRPDVRPDAPPANWTAVPGGQATFEACRQGAATCQRYRLHVKNGSPDPVHVTVLWMGPDGSVGVVFPSSRQKESLVRPGKPVLLGTSGKGWIVRPPLGRVHWKAIATRVPAPSLSGLEYAVTDVGTGSGGERAMVSHPLGRLLRGASGARSSGLDDPFDAWGTADFRMTVQKARP